MRPEPQSKLSPGQSPPPVKAVVLGASAGAVEALSVLLPTLPAGYRLPLLAVVHLGRDKESRLAELMQTKCRLRVKEAEDKEPIEAGTVYFAPPDYHLLVEPERRLSLSSEEPVLFCRPAIDLLFESAADCYGSRLVGVVLTGANSDGARGLAAVCAAGGTGVVQRPASAQMPTMPEAALAACPSAQTMSLEEMAAFLQVLPSEIQAHGE